MKIMLSYTPVTLQAYGLPSGWNSLDLLELGDLLIVMRSSDLAEVSPTSLRLAASQLANNSAYSTILTEVRENPPVDLAFVHVRLLSGSKLCLWLHVPRGLPWLVGL